MEPVFIPLGSLSTVSEISKWCNVVWIFSNSQGNFLVFFLCQFFHPVFFILSFWNAYWVKIGLPGLIPLFFLIISSFLGIFIFWLIFLGDLPILSAKSSFLALLFLISERFSFLCFYHSWIKAFCLWLMGTALLLISQRILYICVVCLWSFSLFPCIVSVSS